jgi:TolB-like protein/DNA-binding winged helix-turn-helix (wHTH) protein/Tfp pilus assembly protein PilF
MVGGDLRRGGVATRKRGASGLWNPVQTRRRRAILRIVFPSTLNAGYIAARGVKTSSGTCSKFLNSSQESHMAHGFNRLYEFGPWQVDPRKLLLLRHGSVVPLPPKAAEILLVLVARSGETVSKDELMKSVWPDSWVEESNLTQNIFLLRKALGETAQDGGYIITIPGKGYRLAAEVHEVPVGDPSPVAVARDLPAHSEGLAVAGAARKIPRLWLLVPVLILIALAVAMMGRRQQHPRPQAAPGRVMLAVLPFENLTGDAGQEYFSDGMTEEMIAQLGNVDPEHLGVIARTSVMHYKNGKTPLDQIGRELAVQYVLEGSVRRDAGKVRITAQLIQMKDQSHLWARRYDRELTSTLELQSEIAQQIAGEIQLALGPNKFALAPEPPRRSSTSYEAYDLYLKGRYFWNKRTGDGFEQAIHYFQQAIAKDPNYAQAYAGLADSYILLAAYSGAPPAESLQKARAAATKALNLDQGLAEAHTSLALITENYDWDWPAAEKEYRRAIELNPNYATAYQWYAEYLTWLGRFDEALRASERARELDPLSLIIAADNGMIFYYSRQYGRAEAKLNAVLEMDPNFPRAHSLSEVYVADAQFAPAMADIEKCRQLFGKNRYWSAMAYALGRAGRTAESIHARDELERSNQQQPVDPAAIAWAYAGVEDKDHTLLWLNKAYAQRSNAMTTLKVEPGYDFLRGDPRFQDLIHRVGLDNSMTNE